MTLKAKWIEDKVMRITTSAVKITSFSAVNGELYLVSPSAAFVNVTLPAPSDGTHIWVKDMSGNIPTKTINIVRNAAESIDGVAADITVESNYGTVHLVSNGTDWFIL